MYFAGQLFYKHPKANGRFRHGINRNTQKLWAKNRSAEEVLQTTGGWHGDKRNIRQTTPDNQAFNNTDKNILYFG